MVKMNVTYSKGGDGSDIDAASSLLVVLTEKELITKISASSLNLKADDYSIFLAVGQSLKPQKETSTSVSFVLSSEGSVKHCTVAVLPTTFSRHNSPGIVPSCFPSLHFYLTNGGVNMYIYIYIYIIE